MRLFFKIMAATFLTCTLAACAVGPDFVRPKPPTVVSYSKEGDVKQYGAQSIFYSTATPASWWTDFQSPALDQVIQLGMKNNYNLLAARETLEQAKEKFYAQQGQLLPAVDLAANVGRQKYGVAVSGPTGMTVPPFTYYEIGPTLALPLDIFGHTRRTIEKQQALMVYQQEISRATAISVVGSIATTALNIAALNEQIATVQTIIREDIQNVRLVEQAFQLGAATKIEILSAKTQQAHDETLLPPLYQQLDITKNTLNVLVGALPADWQPPNFKLQNFTLPKKLLLTIPSTLVHKRPDILAAEALLQAASAEIGIATANLYPTIQLSSALTQEALSPSHLFQGSASAWSLLSSLTAPIFHGGALHAERRAAIHAFKAASANYQQTVLKAFTQVSDVLHALKNDEQALRREKQAVSTAKASLNLARLSYQAGSVGILQVLDAERLYTQAQLGYVQAETQRYQDTVQFYIAVGF